MPNMLNTSLTGLLSFQRAIAVTSHNISNVNTDGYARQRPELSSINGQSFGNGFFGRGVNIVDVSRMTSVFVEGRLTQAIADNGRTAIYAELTSRLSDVMASDDAGVAPALESFFAAMQEVSNDPSNPTPRRILLSEAESLAGTFQLVDEQLTTIGSELNDRIRTAVADINAIADDIARINQEIINAIGQSGGHSPNDLLDQRQSRINDLAALVSVRTLEQDNGAISVFVGNGQPLVVNTTPQTLTTRLDYADPANLEVALITPGLPAISDQLSGGELGGLLDFRREALTLTRNELGRMATVLVDTFNTQHRRGMDADGNLGLDFFSTAPPSALSNALNVGSAAATATVVDSTALMPSNYDLFFDGAQYTLTRLTDGTAVTGAGPLTLDGIQVSIAGAAAAGDRFLIKPVARGAELFTTLITDVDRVAAADPVQSLATVTNLGDATIAQPATVDPTDPALLDAVDIVFNTPASTFDVVDVATATTIAAGVPYVPGASIAFNGWSTSIDGAPAPGDGFRVQSNVGGLGDNRNALALVALQRADLVEGKSTYAESFSDLVAGAGITARQAAFNAEAREQLLGDAEAAREGLSGVNLDEEAIDLTRYQQAYQAMARVVDISNTLFDSLLAAVR
jgi:flagellar hook-associated protein 1 FlgK